MAEAEVATASKRKPCFFKVLMPGFLDKLEIPRAFLKHIILKKHKIITILSPLEKEFFVKIEGDYPNLYFGEGWKDFAEVHDMDVGYFLVFCYEGGVDFTVIILDTSSCQKEYAHLSAKEGIPWRSFEKNTSMMKGNTDPKTRRKRNLNKNSSVEWKRARSTKKEGKWDNKMRNNRKARTNTNIKNMCVDHRSPHASVEGESESDILDAIDRSNLHSKIPHIKTQCDEPFGNTLTPTPATSCRVVVRRRNLQGHYYIYIPVKFKEATGIRGKHELILRDQNGKLWNVEVLHSTANRTFFVRGWKEFCIRHMLKPGDECEFRLAPNTENGKKVVEVKIFKLPKMQRSTALEVQHTCGADTKALSFWVKMSPYKLRINQIAIPNAFSAATNISDKKEVTLKDEKNREFCIGLSVCTRKRIFFGRGWINFASRNELEDGDICTFSLNRESDDNWIFHVEVSRKST